MRGCCSLVLPLNLYAYILAVNRDVLYLEVAPDIYKAVPFSRILLRPLLSSSVSYVFLL